MGYLSKIQSEAVVEGAVHEGVVEGANVEAVAPGHRRILFVDHMNLSSISEAQLRQWLMDQGCDVEGISIVDTVPGHKYTYGFVTFNNNDDASRVAYPAGVTIVEGTEHIVLKAIP